MLSGIPNSVLWLVAVVVLAVIFLGARKFFSPGARETRRRTRSHGPVVSRKRGPNIHLAVDAEKPGRKRKR